MLKCGDGSFKRLNKLLLDILAKIEGRENAYKGLVEIFGGSKEMTFAMIIQNCMHPKNSQRTDSIKNGTYAEINSDEDAEKFLVKLLGRLLKYEL